MKWTSVSSASLLLTLATILLEMSSSLAQRSRGDMCVGQGRTDNCDSQITNLICYEGRCRCPEALVQHDADLPINLNTRWNAQLGKCFATKGARCDIHATKKQVVCFPGVTCVPDPKNPEAGTCGTSQLLTSWPILLSTLTFGIYYLH